MRSTIVLLFLLIILSFFSIFIGVLDVDMKGILNGEHLEVLFVSRLPRLLAIILSGIALSVAGLIMQQLCQNNFVSPTTGGTIASAQFGILLALIFIPSSTIFQRAIFAFATAMIGTWIYVAFIQAIKFKDAVMVALVGIMFGYVIGGITNYFAFRYDMVQALSTWITGSFSLIIKGRYEILYLALPLVVLAFIFANYFNIVGMGKDFSKNLGVNYNVVLFLGLSLSAMLTASVVVVVGSISYIGLIVPNLIRMFKGDKLQGTIVDIALFGAVFVLICDILGRVIMSPYELPIELISGILGSIIFIVLIIIKLNGGKFNIIAFANSCFSQISIKKDKS
ncbi:MAG: iron chelate uptake ABC transporter family permease subunit [Campylobacter sputorum]|uniref:ABC transporter permease n=1 Tax=Campylobacter sputorum TaxID=206 RepID=UPI00191467F8|nr:iron chelate uptake ABC transporter family permease subunit [Campylobacter sputorum]ASM38786.1 ferric enterobactin ABC transporter CeuBCDE, permease protein [Campylobacter sputorum bv. paraureolyticus LMG 11764]MDY6120562.1 iron chelate uptake ABC transporter family permease subunit [Campylobacter sputorum]